jgi:spore maturation protein CgeB
LKVFYDLDTPVTLARRREGLAVPYLPANGLSEFDLVLSFTGGAALERLRSDLGASRVAPLYGSVDPAVHFPARPREHYQCDLSYLGTYSADRQDAVEELFVEPARLRRDRKFVMAGAQYPEDFPWTENIFFVQHLAPGEHPAFFSSSRLTLNVTREPMKEMGWCPSGRLFEAAACGAPLVSDWWPGLSDFFVPGKEVLIARERREIVQLLSLDRRELAAVGERARRRVLAEHTGDHRALELEALLRHSMNLQPAC